MIITDLGLRQKSASNAENIIGLPKTQQMSSSCCFLQFRVPQCSPDFFILKGFI